MQQHQKLLSQMRAPKKSRTRDVGAERPIPPKIQPMMAQSSSQPFDDPEWIFEMKWDGYRALATIDSGHDAIEGREIEFFRSARERGLEGIMAKRKESRYLPGRRSMDEGGVVITCVITKAFCQA
jgi:ATP-dependent DNA ligase